jgi:hypothetical protein
MTKPDGDTLRRLYVDEDRTLAEVAAATGFSVMTIWHLLVRHGIQRRAIGMKRRTADERFTCKYQVTESGCWRWTAGHTPLGYGLFRMAEQMVYAHRWSYARARGPVPEGLELDHLCRIPSCVNPAHLEPVSHEVNMQRAALAAKSPGNARTDAAVFDPSTR